MTGTSGDAASATPRRGRRILLTVALTAFLIDVGSKVAGVRALEGSPVELFGGVLTLRVVRNSGVAFGIAAGASTWILLSVTALIATTLAVMGWRGRLGGPVPVGLILGGAVGNVVDRAVDGTVVDLIDLGWWPSFNLGDVFIVGGAAFLFLGALQGQHPPHSGVTASEGEATSPPAQPRGTRAIPGRRGAE